MDYPRYTYPPALVLGLAANVFLGGRRSFRGDGQACIGRLVPPLRVDGAENIPSTGPCLLTFNHYYRPGFDAWWMALALAASVPAEIHFVMTGELTYPGRWYAPLGQAGSRWLLRRFAKIYGFTAMPPMPPRPRDVARRARAVRAVLAHVKAHPQVILGLAPEGGDQPGGVLNWPPAGSGRFVTLLAGMGLPLLPAGAFEDEGHLCLSFGEAYRLGLPDGPADDGRDRLAAGMVMRKIALQLPARLRGEFG